jgi:hypothetical protein
MARKVISWAINVEWSDGKEENITEIDDDTASSVDTFLTELEQGKHSE